MKSLLSEPNKLDSVVFVFEDRRRYYFHRSELGLTHARDLVMKNQGPLSLLNPSWRYYLYCLGERKGQSLSSWLGKLQCINGKMPERGECHLFISRDKHSCTILYMLSGEYIHINLHSETSVYRVKRELSETRREEISFSKVCTLLTDKKETKKLIDTMKYRR